MIVLFRSIFLGGNEFRTVNGEKTKFPLVSLLTMVFSTVLILFMVFSYIQITELSADIAGMKKEIVALSAKEEKLRDNLRQKYFFRDIEDTAGELGLAKDAGQIVILSETKEAE